MVDVVTLIPRTLAIGFALFILCLLGYFVGLHKIFIVMKHKKKLGDAKVFMAILNQKFPPSSTMETQLREERVNQMIKSGFPTAILEKAQQLVAQDKKKIQKEVKKNGLQLQKQKPTSTTGSTGSTTDTGATKGNGDNRGDKELKQPGVLPISQTPTDERDKPKLKWDWDTIKSNRTSP